MPSNSGLRILLTGGAGLLGRHLASRLRVAGHDVVSVDRSPVDFAAEGAIHHCADIVKWAGLEATINAADVLVHAAASTDVAGTAAADMLTGNIALSARVLLAAADAGIGRIVYASSQSALGFSRAPQPIVPDYVPVDEWHRSHATESYGLSKRVGEDICAMISARYAIPTVSLRFPVIWAPEGRARHVGLRMGDPVQAVKSFWSYVDVRDAAEAVLLAATVGLPQGATVLNISARWPFCDGDIRDHVAAHFGAVPGAADLRMDRPVYAVVRAAEVLGFQARYRWWPDRIETVSASPDAAIDG
jgi:nucleoside-diphosphate-sugar epimerase